MRLRPLHQQRENSLSPTFRAHSRDPYVEQLVPDFRMGARKGEEESYGLRGGRVGCGVEDFGVGEGELLFPDFAAVVGSELRFWCFGVEEEV